MSAADAARVAAVQAFDEALTNLLNAELARNDIDAIVTGFVVIAECDRVEGPGSDFIAGFESFGQKKTKTFGLLSMYNSMRQNEEFMNDLVAHGAKLDRGDTPEGWDPDA